jgi:hypothetical protein
MDEQDTIFWTSTFGRVFWLFFRPSSGLKKELDTAWNDVALESGKFTAVHCRVRHPKGHPAGAIFKGKRPEGRGGPVDRIGLSWNDSASRKYAVETASTALSCASAVEIATADESKVFFFSDSEDLVKFVIARGGEGIDADDYVPDWPKNMVIRSRHNLSETLHIDRQTESFFQFNHDNIAANYYSTFIDVFLASQAKCIVGGVGNYALLASKLGGIASRCLYWYGVASLENRTVDDNIFGQDCPIL